MGTLCAFVLDEKEPFIKVAYNHSMKNFFIFVVYLFLWVSASASVIDVTKTSQSLLEKSSVYYDQQGLSFSEVKKKSFEPLTESYINRAFDAKTVVWIYLELYNPSTKVHTSVLEIDNPRLEYVTLFDTDRKEARGMLHVNKVQNHLYPSFTITLEAKEHRDVWLQVKNTTTALQFELFSKSPIQYHRDEHTRQNSIIFFFGVLSAFLALSLILYVYLKDNSYLYYAFYLMTLLFQQMTYVGFIPLHAPQWFIEIDNVIAVPKISIMIIAAAWYAMHFLKTERFRWIHRIYQAFIVVLIVLMPIIGTSYFYYPEVPVLIGLVFIVFNTIAGIYIYTQGTKQARFFIAGWLVLIFAYLLMIADALGVINGMHKLPSLLLWATSLEALLLLLAFVDRFALVQSEKEQLHADFLLEYNLRQKIIENEVAEKTETLSETIKQKELLFKELHHRVKNNLQLILSLIRIQHDYSTCGEEGTMLTQLEGRISAIARTHELLYQSSGDERVDMDVYVQDYVESMDASLRDLNLELQSDVEATLPLKEAVYVGLIINELVSNAMKYAYEKEGGIIHIRLHESGQVKTLEVCDEGKGYNEQLVEEKSLGLVLVHTLVEEQLEGTLELDITEGTHYTIRFVI